MANIWARIQARFFVLPAWGLQSQLDLFEVSADGGVASRLHLRITFIATGVSRALSLRSMGFVWPRCVQRLHRAGSEPAASALLLMEPADIFVAIGITDHQACHEWRPVEA